MTEQNMLIVLGVVLLMFGLLAFRLADYGDSPNDQDKTTACDKPPEHLAGE